MDLPQIESRLSALLQRAGDGIPPRELQDMLSLVQGGEPGIALENFCTQLFEYDVAVSVSVVDELATLGQAMGVEPDYWESLKKTDNG